MTTVAEGIEELEQSVQLRALSCAMGQGYLYSRPLPVEEIEGLLDGGTAAEVA